ncbi:MAG: hypothetical protein ACI30S_08445 [Muribaculaceae bacterium]
MQHERVAMRVRAREGKTSTIENPRERARAREAQSIEKPRARMREWMQIDVLIEIPRRNARNAPNLRDAVVDG